MGTINTMDQVVKHPQVQARGASRRRQSKNRRCASETFGAPWESARASPLLGQHTDEVLDEYLGMNDAEISALRYEGVMGEKQQAYCPISCWETDRAPWTVC